LKFGRKRYYFGAGCQGNRKWILSGGMNRVEGRRKTWSVANAIFFLKKLGVSRTTPEGRCVLGSGRPSQGPEVRKIEGSVWRKKRKVIPPNRRRAQKTGKAPEGRSNPGRDGVRAPTIRGLDPITDLAAAYGDWAPRNNGTRLALARLRTCVPLTFLEKFVVRRRFEHAGATPPGQRQLGGPSPAAGRRTVCDVQIRLYIHLAGVGSARRTLLQAITMDRQQRFRPPQRALSHRRAKISMYGFFVSALRTPRQQIAVIQGKGAGRVGNSTCW